jgi:hypothetical protein
VPPAAAVDDGAEQPEREEEHDHGNPEPPRRQRGGRFGADVRRGDTAVDGAQAERGGEVEDAEGDGGQQADEAGRATVAARTRRFGSLNEDRLGRGGEGSRSGRDDRRRDDSVVRPRSRVGARNVRLIDRVVGEEAAVDGGDGFGDDGRGRRLGGRDDRLSGLLGRADSTG